MIIGVLLATYRTVRKGVLSRGVRNGRVMRGGDEGESVLRTSTFPIHGIHDIAGPHDELQQPILRPLYAASRRGLKATAWRRCCVPR